MSGLVAHFQAMAANNAWANARLLDACEALSEAEFAAKRVSFFPSLAATLNHNLSVDRYYLDALEGRTRAYGDREPASFARPADVKAAQAEEDARLAAFCGSLDADRLAAEVDTDRGADGRIAERVDCLLAHLFQHQIHHRGQAHAMLAETDVAPPQLDEFFLRYDRPHDAVQHGAPR